MSSAGTVREVVERRVLLPGLPFCLDGPCSQGLPARPGPPGGLATFGTEPARGRTLLWGGNGSDELECAGAAAQQDGTDAPVS
jgi:hypothetical protein